MSHLDKVELRVKIQNRVKIKSKFSYIVVKKMLKYWPKLREVLDNVLMYFIPTKGEYLPQNDPK